jgi:hypothetical protein
MAETSTKRRNIIVVAVIIVVLVISLATSLIVFYYQPTTNLSLNISTNQTEAVQGDSLQAQVNVISIGKAEHIALSGNSDSSGINCTFEPINGMSNFTSTLTLAIPSSTVTGNYNVTITASGNEHVENVSFIVPVLSANVTVSGEVGVIAPFDDIFHLNYSLNKIQFTDNQTGTVTSFRFLSQPYATSNVTGNYSVALLNGHTYHVEVYFASGGDNYDNVWIYAPAGQTAITKNFP